MKAFKYINSRKKLVEYLLTHTVYYYQYGGILGEIYYVIDENEKVVISGDAKSALYKMILAKNVKPILNNDYK